MKTLTQPNLSDSHTFHISQSADVMYRLEQRHELVDLRAELLELPLIIGEGANLLFIEQVRRPLVKLDFCQVKIEETQDHYLCRVEAGKNWHQLVDELTQSGIGGLENLALIPGTVGAAPIQNIGAYGVEFCQLCESVEVFDWHQAEFRTLSAQACQFGYRNSLFKSEQGKGLVVVAVNLKLSKAWQPKVAYQGVQEQLDSNCPSPSEVMEAVVQLRQQKLPDPNQVGNAGSFFKNPTLSFENARSLAERYPSMPQYPLADGVKVPAAWLIDQRGWKGKVHGGAQVHSKQALVIVNPGQAQAREIISLAHAIQSDVSAYYGVILEPEVRFIGALGEVTLEQAYAKTCV